MRSMVVRDSLASSRDLCQNFRDQYRFYMIGYDLAKLE